MDDTTSLQQLDISLRENAEWTRMVAADSSTDSELLRELALCADKATCMAVAANPNTPPDILLRLGAEFPSQLLDNPVFPLLLLENPNLVAELPLSTLQSILRQENVPVYILEQAADRADLKVQLALVTKAQTSKAVLNRLTQSRHSQVTEAARLHVNFAGELTEAYEQKSTEVIQGIIPPAYKAEERSLFILAQVCPIPLFIVEYWVRETRYQGLCRTLAESPAALPKMLECLANHADVWVQQRVACNPNTPEDTLRHLATEQDKESIPVYYVARNPNIPSDTLERLAKDKKGEVRLQIAQNPNTPLTVLKDLADDEDRKIAETAAKAIAAKQGEYDVTVLKDPNTPSYVLELAQKTSRSVIEHPNAGSISELVAEHPNAPLDLLLKFSRSNNWYIRGAVAGNPSTPVTILEQLAHDEMSYVRCNVAGNPRTPLRILFKHLVRDTQVNTNIAYRMSDKPEYYEQDRILDLLAQESTSPLETILQRLVKDGGIKACLFLAQRSDLSTDLLAQLAQADEYPVSEAVAQNLNTPMNSLVHLANDKEPRVRKAVAQNPNTPIDTLEQLARDENTLVRMSAAERTSLPSQVLEGLAVDKVLEVRTKAMANPNLSKESVERILCGEYAAEYLQQNPNFLPRNPDSLAVVVNHYAKSESKLVSYIVLLQPQISQQLLQEKSGSIVWLERFAVAQNPQISLELLKQLAEDSNQLVRAAAKDRLQQII